MLLAQILTESDVFKVILNNGFMALFVVWVLFKGEPRYREMIDRMEQKHADTIEKLMKSHEAVMAAQAKECRDERREIMATIAKEGELNRESRHEANNSLVSAIAEVYRGSERERNRNNRANAKPGTGERPALPPDL